LTGTTVLVHCAEFLNDISISSRTPCLDTSKLIGVLLFVVCFENCVKVYVPMFQRSHVPVYWCT
jgi:hypothetical protein